MRSAYPGGEGHTLPVPVSYRGLHRVGGHRMDFRRRGKTCQADFQSHLSCIFFSAFITHFIL